MREKVFAKYGQTHTQCVHTYTDHYNITVTGLCWGMMHFYNQTA